MGELVVFVFQVCGISGVFCGVDVALDLLRLPVPVQVLGLCISATDRGETIWIETYSIPGYSSLADSSVAELTSTGDNLHFYKTEKIPLLHIVTVILLLLLHPSVPLQLMLHDLHRTRTVPIRVQLTPSIRHSLHSLSQCLLLTFI